MSKRNENYWRERTERLIEFLEKQDINVSRELYELYSASLFNIQKEIHAFYSKYAEDHGMSYKDAQEYLDGTDLTDYQRLANEYRVQESSLTPSERVERLRELNRMYDSSKVRRMDALALSLSQELANLNEGMGEATKKYLEDIAKHSYANGLDGSFDTLDTPNLKQLISTPIDGKNYSDHLWDNTTRLATELRKVLQEGFVRGLGADEMGRMLAKKMNVSKAQAMAVVRTDGTLIMNQSALKRYQDDGLQYYKDLVTKDARTSDICKKIDELDEVKRLDEAVVGVSIAPYHVNCRTGIVPTDEELMDDSHIREIEEMRRRGELEDKIAFTNLSKDLSKAFDEIERNPDITRDEIQSLFKNRYKVGTLLKNEFIKVFSGQEVYIEGHLLSYLLTKHRKAFTKEVFSYIPLLIEYPDYIFEDIRKNDNVYLLNKQIDSNKFLEGAITDRDGTIFFHLVVRNEKKNKKRISKIVNSGVKYKKVL